MILPNSSSSSYNKHSSNISRLLTQSLIPNPSRLNYGTTIITITPSWLITTTIVSVLLRIITLLPLLPTAATTDLCPPWLLTLLVLTLHLPPRRYDNSSSSNKYAQTTRTVLASTRIVTPPTPLRPLSLRLPNRRLLTTAVALQLAVCRPTSCRAATRQRFLLKLK